MRPMSELGLEKRRAFDWRTFLQRFGPLVALIILVAYTASESESFLTPANIANILRQNAPIGILALGMTFVIILGGIDLSVGSLVALAGGVGIWTMNTAFAAENIIRRAEQMAGDQSMAFNADSAFRVWLAKQFVGMGMAGDPMTALLLGSSLIVLLGAIGGLLNGLLISRGRLAPFIATLGTMAAYRSIAVAMVDAGEFRPDAGIRPSEIAPGADAAAWTFRYLGQRGINIPWIEVREGVPLQIGYPVIVFFALILITWIILRRTRYGRYVIAIGCNEQAARYSAINVEGVKLLTYLLMGLLTGIAALLQASRFNSVASSSSGQLYELDAIAAVVIGGTSMRGGSGTIFGTVVGVLILGVISNMLNMLNISPYLHGLVKGVIVIGAVLIQRGRANQ